MIFDFIRHILCQAVHDTSMRLFTLLLLGLHYLLSGGCIFCLNTLLRQEHSETLCGDLLRRKMKGRNILSLIRRSLLSPILQSVNQLNSTLLSTDLFKYLGVKVDLTGLEV